MQLHNINFIMGRMLRQSLSLKPSFKIRENPIVSLRGSFCANWYAETRFIFKPGLADKSGPYAETR